MVDVFAELRRAIEFKGKPLAIARVVATDAGSMTADIIIEGERVVRAKAALRIFNDADNLGVALIPAIDSEVLIGFVDGQEARPQVLKVQHWDRLIMRKGPADNPLMEITIDSANKVDLRKASGFQFTIDSEDKVAIGNAPSHKLAWGDKWLEKFNMHTHPTPTGPSGLPMQPLIDTEVNSQIFTVE
jgi:hypothetical protein